VKVIFYPTPTDFQKSIAFGRFPGSGRLSFYQQQHVDEDEYGASME
jgi:hypothetical protein